MKQSAIETSNIFLFLIAEGVIQNRYDKRWVRFLTKQMDHGLLVHLSRSHESGSPRGACHLSKGDRRTLSFVWPYIQWRTAIGIDK
jgi:hypothetical protein